MDLAENRQPGDRRPAGAATAGRDFRLQPAHGRYPSARWTRGARRHPLVRPARGFPHRGAQPDEDPDGEERRHRAGGLQGRLLCEETTDQRARGQRHARAGPGRGHRLLPDADPRPARPHRQLHRRRHRATGQPGAPRRRRSLPRGRRRQGHGHLLRHRQCARGRLRLLAGRCLRLGRLGRLRPQEDGHHGARRMGIRQTPLPRAGTGHPVDALHGGGRGRHVGRRVRQRHAAVAPHQAGRRLRPPPHLHRSLARPGRELGRAQAAVRPAAILLDGLQ